MGLDSAKKLSRLITSLIKGALEQGRGAPAAWVVGFLPKSGFLEDTNFAHSRHCVRASDEAADGAPCGLRSPDAAPPPGPGRHASDQRVPLLWGQVGPKKCAQTEDCRILVQTSTFIFNTRLTRAGAPLASSHRERCFAVPVHHALCPIMFSSFIS